MKRSACTRFSISLSKSSMSKANACIFTSDLAGFFERQLLREVGLPRGMGLPRH
jgi:hypothetical protein